MTYHGQESTKECHEAIDLEDHAHDRPAEQQHRDAPEEAAGALHPLRLPEETTSPLKADTEDETCKQYGKVHDRICKYYQQYRRGFQLPRVPYRRAGEHQAEGRTLQNLPTPLLVSAGQISPYLQEVFLNKISPPTANYFVNKASPNGSGKEYQQ